MFHNAAESIPVSSRKIGLIIKMILFPLFVAEISNIYSKPHPLFGIPIGLCLFIYLLFQMNKPATTSVANHPIHKTPYDYRAERILKYCKDHGIMIAPGFDQDFPGRYVIVRIHLKPPKLIAITWGDPSDLIQYVNRFIRPELGHNLSESLLILDLEEGVKLEIENDTLKRGQKFCEF